MVICWWFAFYHYSIVNNLRFLGPLLVILPIVISATYLSLLERHFVAIVQQRSGPSVAGMGLLQPLADAFKLLSKDPTRPYRGYNFIFRMAPVYTFVCAVSGWAIIPLSEKVVYLNFSYGLLIILLFFELNSFGVIFGAWASQNKYALFSALRGLALANSYGISILLVFVYPAALGHSFNLINIVYMQSYIVWFWLPGLPIVILFWVILLTEIKKIPFDVTESEAELGSGYLIEYSGMGFALFIISEYIYLLLITALFSVCFLGGWLPFCSFFTIGIINFVIKILFCLCCYLLVRSSLPNYRFDYIMSVHWRCLFPLLLSFIMMSMFFCLT